MKMEKYIQPSSFGCTNCGNSSPLNVDSYECSHCRWPLQVLYSKEHSEPSEIRDALTHARRLWDFFGFLPIGQTDSIVSLGEGGTPLLSLPLLQKDEHISVFVKNEGVNPTGSFKDRPLSVILSMAKEYDVDKVVTGSSGNAGVALSAYAARAGIGAIVVVPRSTPQEKVLCMKAYGARVIMIEGNTSQALVIANQLSRKKKWVNATTNFQNPYGLEGDKTVAYEIARDLDFKSPTHVLIPIGAGPLLVGCYLGFLDLYNWGLIDSIPHLVGVQAEGCAPIARAFEEGKENVKAWESSKTIASGIADELRGYETDGALTLRVIRQTNGTCLHVSDKEIIEATKFLAETSGLFAEPTGAVSLAGFMDLLNSGSIGGNSRVVCVVTGTGFKDLRNMEAFIDIKSIPVISPEADEALRILEMWE